MDPRVAGAVIPGNDHYYLAQKIFDGGHYQTFFICELAQEITNLLLLGVTDPEDNSDGHTP
jgi:hypothetical protein